MRNGIRRSRNIGTAKQGYGQNNRLKIAQPYGDSNYFYERIGAYEKSTKTINNHEFVFIVEQLREHSSHACSIADISTIIEQIPEADYGDLKFIVLRQPKRKEETLSQTWGRLVYSYEFEGEYYPAIIIDAFDPSKQLKWPKKLTINDQKEFERLKSDGHQFIFDGRRYIAELRAEIVRNTQLYRTLIHEFGHYIHYLEQVERPSTDNEEYEEFERRIDLFFKIPSAEKEQFAHHYAEKLMIKLKEKMIIPFDSK